MKLLSIVLSLLLLTGCASTVAKLDAAEDYLDAKTDAVEQTIETKAETILSPAPADHEDLLTEEEAASIAVEHAGLTAEQAGNIRVSYEFDDGIPEYEVEFFSDHVEYEYTIHAETGKILSYSIGD